MRDLDTNCVKDDRFVVHVDVENPLETADLVKGFDHKICTNIPDANDGGPIVVNAAMRITEIVRTTVSWSVGKGII